MYRTKVGKIENNILVKKDFYFEGRKIISKMFVMKPSRDTDPQDGWYRKIDITCLQKEYQGYQMASCFMEGYIIRNGSDTEDVKPTYYLNMTAFMYRHGFHPLIADALQIDWMNIGLDKVFNEKLDIGVVNGMLNRLNKPNKAEQKAYYKNTIRRQLYYELAYFINNTNVDWPAWEGDYKTVSKDIEINWSSGEVILKSGSTVYSPYRIVEHNLIGG